jgi:hypothetical protein
MDHATNRKARDSIDQDAYSDDEDDHVDYHKCSTGIKRGLRESGRGDQRQDAS